MFRIWMQIQLLQVLGNGIMFRTRTIIRTWNLNMVIWLTENRIWIKDGNQGCKLILPGSDNQDKVDLESILKKTNLTKLKSFICMSKYLE